QPARPVGPGLGAVADLNGDGILDLAGTRNGRVGLLLGNGDGTFQDAGRFAAGAEPQALTAGDFNGDGLLDLAVVNHNSLSVLFNDGNWSVTAGGYFAPPRARTVSTEAQMSSADSGIAHQPLAASVPGYPIAAAKIDAAEIAKCKLQIAIGNFA